MNGGKSALLIVSEKDIRAVRDLVKLSDEDAIIKDVDMVIEWFDKQQHLPRIQIDRHMVERILILRKGSVEQTKQKIDQLYTLRNLIPDLAAPRDILHPRIQRHFKGAIFAVMPRLNNDLTRVCIVKLTEDVDNYDFTDFLRYIFMTLEYRMRYDYETGDRYVFDVQHAVLGHIVKTNPVTLKNGEIYFRKAYSGRISGIHYINAPSFMGKILNLMKGALSEKVSSRIMVHPTFQDLHNHVSKASLPKDYGGDDVTLDILVENWKEELGKKEHREYLIQQESLRSNEALRLGTRVTDDMLGLPGSFKKINVD